MKLILRRVMYSSCVSESANLQNRLKVLDYSPNYTLKLKPNWPILELSSLNT